MLDEEVKLMVKLPRTCSECPLARPLFNDRFACGNSLTKVVRGHFPATAECHESVWNHPEKYFQPEILPDLQGLEPEWICARIKLNLNWLDIYPDEREIRAGENAIEVTHQRMTADIKKRGDRYYCTRIARLESTDPYWLALHLVHPDYLYSVVDEIVTARASLPDYF
jgi:hypothetical protein